MKIHVVEDDRVFNKLIEKTLVLNPDFHVSSFFKGKDFIPHLDESPDVVTLDLGLPDIAGDDLLKHIRKFSPETDVIIISGQDDISTAVTLLKEGAYDYITKDQNIKERLLHSINNLYKQKSLKKELVQLKSEISDKYTFNNAIIGESNAIKSIFSLINKAIKVPNINVSIYGETGTGKELVAKTIHYNSDRKNKAFIAVNMGAIPKDLIESELFGHEKGAFTGAINTQKGKFEEAEGGTIFLDEIGEMDLNLQVKLLRVLQEREITRVGSSKAIKTNIRIITATNKDLSEEVQKGTFREDLYFRLLGLPIHLPPLKDRDKDCILLSHFFLKNFCKDNHLNNIKLSSGAKKKILKYQFPGNIRELKAMVELGAVLTDSDTIEEEHIIFQNNIEEFNFLSEDLTLKDYTEKIIKLYLQKYDNNVLLVAKKLSIGKSTIYNLIKKAKETSNYF